MIDKRTPPQDLESEQAVIGCMMIEEPAIVKALAIVGPDDFYRNAHKVILQAIADLHARREAVDLTTLAAHLDGRGQLESVGGRPYLAACFDSVSTAGHIEHYARIVAGKSLLRQLISRASKAVEAAFGDVEDYEAVVAEASASIHELTQRRTRRTQVSAALLMDETLSSLLEVRECGGVVNGVTTGIKVLDYATNGWQPEEMIVMGAEPGAGKTSFAMNNLIRAGLDGKRGLFESIEMGKGQFGYRLVQIQAKVRSQLLRSGRWSQEQHDRMVEEIEAMKRLPIRFDFPDDLSVESLEASAREAENELGGLDWIAVDYLHLMSSRRKYQTRREELEAISKQLKQLARRLGIPVLVISSLSREGKIRETKQVEFDCDVRIMLAHDEEGQKGLHWQGFPVPQVMKITIAKQRCGPTGDFPCLFFPDYCRYEDYDPSDTYGKGGF